MEGARRGARLVVTFAIVAAFVWVVWLAADALGAWDVYQAQAQARAAEARARELEARTTVFRERQAMWQTWVTVFASAKDSTLVTVTYVVGGVLLMVCAVALMVLMYERGKHHERDV